MIELGERLASEADARAWLAAAGEPELEADIAILNRVLYAFRLVTADPYLGSIGRHQLLVARIGYGAGDEVADGLWTDARELLMSERRQRRKAVLHAPVPSRSAARQPRGAAGV